MFSNPEGIMAGAPCPVEVMKQIIDKMHCKEMTVFRFHSLYANNIYVCISIYIYRVCL